MGICCYCCCCCCCAFSSSHSLLTFHGCFFLLIFGRSLVCSHQYAAVLRFTHSLIATNGICIHTACMITVEFDYVCACVCSLHVSDPAFLFGFEYTRALFFRYAQWIEYCMCSVKVDSRPIGSKIPSHHSWEWKVPPYPTPPPPQTTTQCEKVKRNGQVEALKSQGKMQPSGISYVYYT